MIVVKHQPSRQISKTPGADVARKLQKVVADITANGNATLTRLTVLKKWFEVPHRLASFGIFIAAQGSQPKGQVTEAETELFRETQDILSGVDVFAPNILRERATQLHTRLRAFQNEHRQVSWNTVRVIHNRHLYLVESGLWLSIGRVHSPTEGYRLAVFYCEHYDPRYGNGLNGPSAERIEEIVAFVRAVEAHEQEEQDIFPLAHTAL